VLVARGGVVGVRLGVIVAARVGISEVAVGEGTSAASVASDVWMPAGTVAGAPGVDSGMVGAISAGGSVARISSRVMVAVGDGSTSLNGVLQARDTATRRQTKRKTRAQRFGDLATFINPPIGRIIT
jgi:hypothetical protein